MGELLLRKLILCRERIEKVRGALPAHPEDIVADERAQAFVAFNLFLLIQDALDLAAHLVAERGLAVAGSQRESLEALARAGILGAESASSMSRMASLRNRIAHSYGDLDVVRMVRETPAGLEAVRLSLDQIAAAVDHPS
jgi:uncharacterized protein YutE (UPF0331/DUF86 family)